MTDIGNLTDAMLLELFVNKQDGEAFQAIFQRHYRLVWSACRRRLCGWEHLAEDAVQAVFLALFRYAKRISNGNALSAWLYQTAGYISAKMIRSEASRLDREKKAVNMNESMREPVLEAGWSEIRLHLDKAIDKLPGKQRDAVVMHFLAGKSLGEISSETGIGKATVQKRVESGIDKLKSMLSAQHVAVSVGGLGAAIAENAMETMPAGLEHTLMSAFKLNISAGGTSADSLINLAVKEIGKIMFIGKLKIAAGIIALAAVFAGASGAILMAQGDKPQSPATGNASSAPSDSTVIEITDKILVKDCIPFGTNLSYGIDSSWASPWVKDRIHESFEGSTYRQCLTGAVQDETGIALWISYSEQWQKIHLGARFTILNGPAKGMTGTIKEISKKNVDGRELPYYVFDKSVPAGNRAKDGLPGIMVEKLLLDEGYIGSPSDFWCPNAGMKNKTPRIDICIGDVHPGSTGRAACHFIAPESGKKAFKRFSTIAQHLGQTNGTWKISFWAKAKAGTPAMEVLAVKGGMTDTAAPTQKITLEQEWKKYDISMEVTGIADPPDWKTLKGEGSLSFVWQVDGGEALLDEVSAQMADEKNPTAFRDDLIATLKRLNVGSVRNLQEGGNTVDNILTPGVLNHRGSSRLQTKPGPFGDVDKLPFSAPEMFALCEYLKCDPWYCLPGTLHPDEMLKFMEFIGAPADTGAGKLRALLGHPKPWTESLRFIHVEFGNEAWNPSPSYHSNGFNGSEYWKDLIDTAKKSPYYKPNVLFHPGGQEGYVDKNKEILGYVPNGDRFTIAPYIITGFRKEDAAFLDTQDKFYRWLLAYPIFRSRDPQNGSMYLNYQAAKAAKMELSIYEINYSLYGDKKSPWLDEPRKRMFTTIGGGIGLVNNMMQMLKEHGIRIQNAFPLASGSDEGIWDLVMSMRKDHERFRPAFLGLAMVNHVIGGDLVETVHSGADVKWTAEGVFYTKWKKEPQFIKYENIPCLMSYAFQDKNKRGLILTNLDLTRSIPVQIKFPGNARDNKASSQLLTADKITACNEWEVGEPQVKVKEEEIRDFKSGYATSVPPFSMMAFTWETPDSK